MDLSDLLFDSANNACISLRIVAEKTRAGDVFVTVDQTHEGLTLTIQQTETIEPSQGDSRG